MLELANAMKVESRDDAMRKQYVLDSVRSALKRLGWLNRYTFMTMGLEK